MNAVVELVGVGVDYPVGPVWSRQVTSAVRGINLTVDRGETVGLVGESGSGKTTMGRVVLGLVRPTTGTVTFEGAPVAARRARGAMQAVFQQPDWALNPRLRVATSVAEPLAILGIGDRAERRRQAIELIERVGMDASIGRRYPHELSGGQRQRAAVARALITDPRFMLFDEVVTALDVSVQAQLLNLIRSLQADRGFAAIFISHDLAVVRYVSDRIAVLHHGDLVETAPSSRFYEQPEHQYSQLLRASIGDA